jgi:hypothetical protein
MQSLTSVINPQLPSYKEWQNQPTHTQAPTPSLCGSASQPKITFEAGKNNKKGQQERYWVFTLAISRPTFKFLYWPHLTLPSGRYPTQPDNYSNGGRKA